MIKIGLKNKILFFDLRLMQISVLFYLFNFVRFNQHFTETTVDCTGIRTEMVE